MTILKTDTVSGIGTEGTVFEGDITFDSLNYMTLPKGTTTQANKGRAVFAGGNRTPDNDVNTISYIQIQSSGTTIDFGDLTQERASFAGSGNETRGWFASGYDYDSPNANYDIIDYITIATTANALDFGNLAGAKRYVACLSNSTRGVSGGGFYPAYLDVIEYITIASAGNATDFGDLSATRAYMAKGQACSVTRGLLQGGQEPTVVNTIQYITIASTGDATDFGDVSGAGCWEAAAACDSHGGLSE